MVREPIGVSNVNDWLKVAQVLQQAVDRVLNPQMLREMAARSGGDQVSQHIYSRKTHMTVGCVSMIVGGYGEAQDITMLSLMLYLSDYHRGSNNVYVPEKVIDKLGVQLDGVSHIRLFERDGPLSNKWRQVRILLPTQTFQRYPRALIKTA